MAVNAKVITAGNQNQDTAATLATLKARIEKGKVERTRAETNFANYTRQKEEIEGKLLTDFNITPDAVDGEISRLETQISDGLRQAEELLGEG